MNTQIQDYRRAAGIFKALSHPGRVQVACLLMSGGPTTQKDLIDTLGWPQSTVARHVGALRAHGLIKATRHGTEVHLEMVEPVSHHLMDAVCEWVHPDTGERLSSHVGELIGA
jgi:predicted transcriptional regulator